MKNRKTLQLMGAGALVGLMVMPALSSAGEWTDRVSISGFASGIYQRSNEADIYFLAEENEAGVNNEGSFFGTRMGLNVNARINDRLTVATQFLAGRKEDNYKAHLDWGFIAMKMTDELTFRAGKIKSPLGLVNEYISVGYAYPWITPPQLYYSETMQGPLITRESYSGASVLWEHFGEEWSLSADLYGGEVALESMNVREMYGLTLTANWNEMVTLQASTYTGTMHDLTGHVSAMDERLHTVQALGARLDWNDVVAYAEAADVDMEDFIAGEAMAWYASLGYRLGDWMPYLTYQYLEKGQKTGTPQQQTVATLGLRHELMTNTALKFEYSRVDTDEGEGLFFDDAPSGDVNMLGMSIDVVF